MARTGRPKAELVLTEDEREQLAAVGAASEVGAGAGVAVADRAGVRGRDESNAEVAATAGVAPHDGGQVAGAGSSSARWTG